MTKDELAVVENEAARFLDLCVQLRAHDAATKVKRANWQAKHNTPNYGLEVGSAYFESPSKDVAAVKRASLDLSRELANLRRRKAYG